MKTLTADNGEVINLEDDIADYFLSRHKISTPSSMAWRQFDGFIDFKTGAQVNLTETQKQ